MLPCCGASVSGSALTQALVEDPASGGTRCVLCATTGVRVDEVVPNKHAREMLRALYEDVKHAKADAAAEPAANAEETFVPEAGAAASGVVKSESAAAAAPDDDWGPLEPATAGAPPAAVSSPSAATTASAGAATAAAAGAAMGSCGGGGVGGGGGMGAAGFCGGGMGCGFGM